MIWGYPYFWKHPYTLTTSKCRVDLRLKSHPRIRLVNLQVLEAWCEKDWRCGKNQLSNEKNPGIILPGCVGIIRNQYEDTYETTSTMERYGK